MKPLIAEDGDVILEITKRCYCGCKWCFKGKVVGSKESDITFEILKNRFLWACQNIEFDTLYLSGGDPILHRQLKEIINLAFTNGKKVAIITSGKISKLKHEQDNLNYVLDLYKKGKIFIELSFQTGRNEKAYKKFIFEIQQRYKSRRRALERKGLYQKQSYDFSSTAVIRKAEISNQSRYRSFVDNVYSTIFGGCTFTGENSEKIDEIYLSFQRHFSSNFDGSEMTILELTSKEEFRGFRVGCRIYGEIQINDSSSGCSTVTKPKGGVCSAMKVNLTDSQITLPSINIRHDGEITFARAECISGQKSLCNTATKDPKEIYDKTRQSLKAIKRHIIKGKRRVAESPNQFCMADRDYPKDSPEAENCTSCRFDFSCNACHGINQ